MTPPLLSHPLIQVYFGCRYAHHDDFAEEQKACDCHCHDKPEPAQGDAIEDKIDDIVYDFVVKDRDPYSAVGFKKKILELVELARGGK